jgi:pimeloyl-ACP methyl ester carboxylesterase
MYDFQGGGAEGVASYPKPSLLLTAAEMARLSVEYPASLLVDAMTPSRDTGNGRPVMVLPGFYAGDEATRRLRAHLDKLGYASYGWGLGRNHGLTDEIIDGVVTRLEQVHEGHGEPVSVVGWSFGGLLARYVAVERPSLVRQVICLGSPWRAEGERTRTTFLFERSAARHGLSPRAREIVDGLRGQLPVLCTAIYSRTDGIVPWRGCALDEGELCENVEVISSHLGLASNPLALAAVADRLAQDPADPEPFDWAGCLRSAVAG